MARTAGEEVTISSIQFTERELPLWATERTHQQIFKAITVGNKNNETLLKNIDKNIASLSNGLATVAEELVDQEEAINDLTDATREGNNDRRKQHRESSKLTKWLGNTFEATSRELEDVLRPTHMAFRPPDFGRIMGAVGKDFMRKAMKVLTPFTLLLPVATSAITSLITRLFDTHETFRTLTEFGVDFNSVLAAGGDRLISFGQAAAQSTLTIQEFSALLTRFSRVAAGVGERRFGMLNREVADLLRPMGMLGLRVDELGDFTGNYLETQRLLGMLQVGQHHNQADAIARNIQMLTAFARVTGVARKQMEESIRVALTEEKFMAFLARLPEEVRQKMIQSVTGMTAAMKSVFGEQGDTMMTPLLDVVRQGMFATEEAIGLFQAAPGLMTEFQNLAETVKNANGDIGVINQSVVGFAESLVNISEGELDMLEKRIQHYNDPYAKSLIQMRNAAISAGAATGELSKRMAEAEKLTEQENKRARDLADGINLWDDTLKRLRLLWDDIIFRFLGLPGVGNKVKEALGFLEGNIDKVVKKLLSIADEVFPAIEAAFKRFEAWFSGFFVGGVFQKEKFQVEISNIVRSGMNTVLASIWDAMLTAIKNWAAAPFRAAGEAIGEEIFDLVHGQGKAGEAAAVEAAGRRGDLGLGKPPKEETAGVGEQLSNALGDVKSDITNALTGSKKPGGRGMILESPRLIPAPTTPPNRTEPEPPGFFARMKNTLGFGNAAVAAEPVRTPLETRRQEEQEENIGPRNNRNTANMTLNTGNPTAEITEALLRETTDLLRTMIEMDNRQVKLLQENRDETRRLQQGLY